MIGCVPSAESERICSNRRNKNECDANTVYSVNLKNIRLTYREKGIIKTNNNYIEDLCDEGEE